MRAALLGVGTLAAAAAVFRSELADAHAAVRERTAEPVEALVAFGVVVSFGYLLLVFALYGTLMIVAGIDSAIRNRERRTESYDVLEASPFTIPVSIVSAVHNEESMVVASVRSLLEQQYPEFEVILVDDGSTDATVERLQEAFGLTPCEIFFRQVVETAPLRGIYRSATEPRLTVVRKENGGKADALNCGLNFSRYRYFLGVDGDSLYRPDALLRAMRLVLQNPAEVIGLTSTIAFSTRPEASHREPAGERTVDRTLLGQFQHLDYLRAFLNNRLAWSRLGFMLCSVGAFQIWRRDVLEEVGGFARHFSCEDIEMTFRLHEKFRREGRPYQILCVPETVGTTEAPDRIRSLIKQRARWQRVIMETVFHYRYMFGNPRYGLVGTVGVPFYVVTEVLAPFVELLAVATLTGGLWLGLVSWDLYALVLGIMAFTAATFSTVAVLLEDRTGREFRVPSLLRMVLVAPLDLFLYRPIMMVARMRGTWDFLRRRRDWDKFERNVRRPAADVA